MESNVLYENFGIVKGLQITSYNFSSEDGRDLRFCITEDDGDYGTKKLNFSGEGSGRANPPPEFFANLGVFLRIFVLDF